jgi:imidazolonepropionase-like amidohydrolase
MFTAVSTVTASTPKLFVRGHWFDGKEFKDISFYTVGGVLTKVRPRGLVEAIDLHGAYVVPAFGDAHNHFPSSRDNLNKSNQLLLSSGVFYVLNPNDIAERSNPIRTELGTPSTVDVIFSHAGFTSSGGHPTKLYEQLAEQGTYPYAKSDLEGRAFYSIDSRTDIETKWPTFLASQPDLVKVFLLHSEISAQVNARPQAGLRPEFATDLIRRAHSAGLRAGAHVESAEDFHNAVVSGADLIMHLPGYWWAPSDTREEYLLRDADLRLARESRVTVVTTIDLAELRADSHLTRVRWTQAQNLRRLKQAGVRIVVGTDTDPGGILKEIGDLQATAVFSNLELLRMLSETTPQAIFPMRRIGRLQEGYDADFLVLRSDPLRFLLQSLDAVSMRVKHGEIQ